MAAATVRQRLRGGGIVDPDTTVAEAARTGLRLAMACALLEKESSGGRNVFGHDPSIFAGAGEVTRDRYAAYKRGRDAGATRRMQGVGPCQLTWWELQDQADREGGCWRPEINMRVGFRHLAGLMKSYGEASGTRRYNGSGAAAAAYSRDLMARARRWETRLAGAAAAAPARRRRAENGRPAAPSLAALIAEAERQEAESDRAWVAVVAHGRRSRRAAAAAAAPAGRPAAPRRANADRPARAGTTTPAGRPARARTTTPAGRPARARVAAPAGRTPRATVTRISEPPPQPPEGPRPPVVTDRALLERLEQIERAEDHARAVLARRFTAAERAAGRRRRAPGGAVVITRAGDGGHLVRSSKRALAAYLKAKGSHEHQALARTLRREARSPRRGRVATPRWERAVRAAQHLAGRPVTGAIDGELHQLLQPYWPRDSAVRRTVRGTPAWRAVPGQLTPNFNVRELGCKDGTGYVAGLMREQGLTKRQARRRARELAKRLERVRKLDGGRPIVPTSAFRTKAYNAGLPGAATNSSHTRGFAVDMPPPRGVSLESHRDHVRAAFECGVGYYPKSRGYFVHGDFDPALGRRSW